MYNQVLKVHGEDLFEGGVAKKVIVNGTMGGLEVVAVATEDGTFAPSISVSACDTKDGSYETVAEKSFSATVAKGEVIGRIALPSDVKRWATATCSDASVRVTLNYLAR